MKRLFLLPLILTILSSCTTELPSTEKYDYSFMDQPLQGTIEGEPFTYEQGVASKGKRLMIVELYDIPFKGDELDSTEMESYQFKIQVETLLDLEVHDLSEHETNVIFSGKSISGESLARNGGVQLTMIDTEKDAVEGRVDVVIGNSTEINGVFKVKLK